MIPAADRDAGAHTGTAVTVAPPVAAQDDAAWLAALRSTGADHDEAVQRLRERLRCAARFEVARRRASVPSLYETLHGARVRLRAGLTAPAAQARP